MRFTLVGHAGLYVESGSTDLLVDPWLLGSCYWRSWWHYPPIGELDPRWLAPRYVYLSHHHFDHFHYPSLRRLDRRTQVLVPRFAVDVMRKELAGLGFHRVVELAHGRPFELGDGLSVRSYQYGVDDSALVVRHGDTVVVDLNDCKLRGPALRQLQRQVGRPTFMLKNYSAAQAYPGCYTAADPADLGLISRASYLEDFLQTAQALSARFAVPFASMTCFLHPESFARNAEVVLPADLVAAAAAQPLAQGELVVLAPGEGWDEAEGFRRLGEDPYRDFEARVSALASEVRPKVAAALAEEATRPLTWEAFSGYFGEFVHSLPVGAGRLFHGSVVFEAPPGQDPGQPFWVVDPRRRRVYRSATLPADWASRVRTPPGVLAQAMEQRIVNFIHISMRLSIELNRGGAQTDFLFWGVLTIFELGYLPLRKMPLGRLAATGWARRRELWGTAVLQLRGSGSGVQRLASSLMPAGAGSPGQDPSGGPVA